MKQKVNRRKNVIRSEVEHELIKMENVSHLLTLEVDFIHFNFAKNYRLQAKLFPFSLSVRVSM